MIQGVLIDLDDTLIDRSGAVRSWLRAVAGAHADALIVADAAGYGDRTVFFRTLAAQMDWSVADAKARFRAGLLERVQLMPGALPCITRLATQAAIAVATNGAAAIQRAKLAACGLDQVIDTVIISETIGVAKPDARFFAHAVQTLGTRPATTLMIGDHPHNDITGASEAGLRTCWVRTPHHAPPPRVDTWVEHLDAVKLS